MGLFDLFRSKPVKATPSKEEVAERIVDAKPTASYKPGTALRQMYGYGNQLPPLAVFYAEIELMLLHPRVQIALDYFKSGVASAEFDVTARRADVKKFIEDQFRRFWSESLNKVQEGYDFGWIGAEVVYRIDDDGRLAFDQIKTFHPRDVKPLMQSHQYCGVRITNVVESTKPVDLFGPGKQRIIGKAFWYAHKSQHGALYGRSQILGAWRPYIRLANQDGGEDTVDMACYRFGVRGVIVKFPPGKPNVKAGGGDSRDPSNQQTADFIGESYKSGGNVSIPSEYDDKGNPKWEVITPEYVLNVDSLVNYNGSLEKQISMGIGVPPELLEASETGSGYSGRQIPLEAFYEGQQNIARDLVRAFREQVVEPLVRWNFGDDEIEFDIDVLPLLQTRSKRLGANQAGGPGTGPERVRDESGHFAPSVPGLMMRTAFDEKKHPRDDEGQWAHAHMTSAAWESHLRSTGQRGQYGPGMGGVKLAHRTAVVDALNAGVDLPDDVRAEYPDLRRKFPTPAKRATVRQQINASKKSEREQWAASAAEFGVKPEHVHGMAAELMKQDREHVTTHNAMLADAFATFAKLGVSRQQILKAEDELPHGDVVGQTIANRHPGLLGTGTAGSWAHTAGENYDADAVDPMAALLPMMQEGKRAPLAEKDAYAKAIDRLWEMKDNGEIGDDSEAEFEDDSLGADVPAGSPKPHEMTAAEFNKQRAERLGKLERAHYQAGFIGRPIADTANSRTVRAGLASSAGFASGTAEHDEAVAKWPLHKLHVAAAIGRGEHIPEHVAGQYPMLKAAAKQQGEMTPFSTGVQMLSTLPGASAAPPADPAADAFLATILEALAPARQRFLETVIRTITSKPPVEWWLSLVQSLDILRETTGQALAIAKVAFALAAMRRVVSESALWLPSDSTIGLPAPSLPVAAGGASEVPPATAAMFGGPADGEPFVSLTLIDEAVNDLAARKVMTRGEFDLITGQARQGAFTVAGVESEQTLGVLRDLVQDAVGRGLDQRQWRAEIDERLGGDPFLSRAHQETVFRANTHSAYTAGGNAILEHPLVADEFPYRAAYPIRDKRARPWHVATATAGLNGTNIYRADDPTWKTIQGPSDYGCRCGWSPVTIAQAARAGVQEAIKWQETGLEPSSPHHVPLPPGWYQSESWVRE